jgi:hypothetical protein
MINLINKSVVRKKRITTDVSDVEHDVIDAIIDYRVNKGITSNKAEFIRQCIQFAINSTLNTKFDTPNEAYIKQFIEKKENIHDEIE